MWSFMESFDIRKDFVEGCYIVEKKEQLRSHM